MSRRSVDFRHLRAKQGYGSLKKTLIEKLRELELDQDHLIIRTVAVQDADPELLARRKANDDVMDVLVRRLTEITVPRKQDA